jgi:hypothetical protein
MVYSTLQRRLVLQFSLGTLGHAFGKVLFCQLDDMTGLKSLLGCCARLDLPWIYVRPWSYKYEHTRPSPPPARGSLLISVTRKRKVTIWRTTSEGEHSYSSVTAHWRGAITHRSET